MHKKVNSTLIVYPTFLSVITDNQDNIIGLQSTFDVFTLVNEVGAMYKYFVVEYRGERWYS